MLETGDKIDWVNPNVGQKYDFALQFKNEGSSVSFEDIYLLCDATGSMSGAIKDAKENFREVVKERSKISGNVQFGVGIFRDEAELDDGFENLASITPDTDVVYAKIDEIRATGGGDFDEANLVALYKIATEESIGWRDDSRKVVVYFGDFPGHEPSCVGGLKITRENVIKALDEKGITVVAVNFGAMVTPETRDKEGLNRPPKGFGCGTGGDLEDAGQANEIAEGTGGDVDDTKEQSELVALIKKLISELPLKYEANTADCDEYMFVSYSPKFGFTLFPDQETTIIQTVELKPGVCELPTDSFECEYKYTASGAGVSSTVVQVNGVKGC